MRVDPKSTGHILTLTSWHVEDPVRVGMYEVALGAGIIGNAHWSGTAWSAPVDPAADRHAHDRARRTPWAPRGARPLWRGLALQSAQWLAAELARD